MIRKSGYRFSEKIMLKQKLQIPLSPAFLYPHENPQSRLPGRRPRHPRPAATKAMPKEMLTIVDKPLIQYVADEAREAGIEHFIFVTGRNKGVIEDHFDRMFELDATLAARGKKASRRFWRKTISTPAP